MANNPGKGFAMRIIKWAVPMVFLAVVGCTGVMGLLQIQSFDEVAEQYRRTISRSDFDYASRFVKVMPGQPLPVDATQLKRFRVTSYTVKRVKVAENKDEIRQYVEIKYYSVKNPIERTLIDHQDWKYNADQDSWFLVSGLPHFK